MKPITGSTISHPFDTLANSQVSLSHLSMLFNVADFSDFVVCSSALHHWSSIMAHFVSCLQWLHSLDYVCNLQPPTCTYINTHTHTYIHTHNTHTYTHSHAHSGRQTHTHMHTHAHKHTHTHTHALHTRSWSKIEVQEVSFF